MNTPRIGVLALQGDYAAHQRVLEALGATTVEVRTPRHLEDVAGLVIPGGESTVMSRLCERYGLTDALRTRLQTGFPVLGTCAGLIFLAREIEGASQNFAQTTLGALDVVVARNAYGAQLDSFETEVYVPVLETNIHAVFIRAPQIRQLGEGVEVLATHEEMPVAVRQGNIVATSFHPEIAGESRLHRLWLSQFVEEGALKGQKP